MKLIAFKRRIKINELIKKWCAIEKEEEEKKFSFIL